jgi:hypothetical protein
MNTQQILQAALDLYGFQEVPSDTTILHPAPDVRRLLVGIDIGDEDVRRAKAEGFDLVVAHHPFDQTAFMPVMDRHEELMIRAGVPAARAAEASRQNKAPYLNWAAGLPPDVTAARLTSLARVLGIGLMNIHNPCDEVGRRMFQQMIDAMPPSTTVSGLMDRFRQIPEMQAGTELVELVCGSPDAPMGRTVMIHAAGTNGGYPVATALFEHGYQTVVYIHLNSPKQRARLAAENKGNLVLTGHYVSDSMGINPLLDALEQAGVEVVCCNRMVRVRRS